ncbi:PQQ-dependent sugar dehydrogenase [Maribacter confluentis]|uniref:PQQ-dependent sugar dehydrogenase n=1 Tax=Maribacter confluentis TaxID=1656093 RepID=A0ABT8RLI4_9FLAO|nr:PQQ-dependent sugar dehydrogenase [Maribacter confluentis]MDO1511749.1 PQQ-dependent sugar dehydrogenase [Maribacter confluentis]
MKKLGIFLISAITVLGLSCSDENELAHTPLPHNTITLTNAFSNLNFTSPLDLQSPNDGTDRLFVAEKGGLIKVFENKESVTETSTFLDLSGQIATENELGLLGFAFHPDYSANGFLFVYYTPNTSEAVVSRFKVSEGDVNQVDSTSETILLRIPQPYTNHNGGQLAFGTDGYLYIASGDGGGSGDPDGNAQNLENLLGKILRIDVDNEDTGLEYAIPADNPFVDTEDARAEIFAYGLRNPWRLSIDLQDNTIWTGDVGQDQKEEIDLIEKGGNYGWNSLEGTSCYKEADCAVDGTILPLYEYGHENNDKSITGGYVYRGNNVPELNGYYVYGDFISGRIWALDKSGNNQLISESGLSISSFGIDADKELYLCSFDGKIYKFNLAD